MQWMCGLDCVGEIMSVSWTELDFSSSKKELKYNKQIPHSMLHGHMCILSAKVSYSEIEVTILWVLMVLFTVAD